MKKTYENSRLEWLTSKEIEANNENESIVIVQVSVRTAYPVIQVENNLQCKTRFLCEVVDREEYEKTTKKGQIKELKKKVEDLTEENEQLFCNLQNAERRQKLNEERTLKAEKKIRDMEAGFRELERVFGDLPPEIVSLYDIPEIKD